MDQEKIGGFLKALRKEKNVTQEALAEQLNVSGRTVSRWETGANMPDISLLVELAEFYEVSIPEIINGERKSEKMNHEAKETALSLSEYAAALNEKIRKRSVWLSVQALAGIVIFWVLDAAGLTAENDICGGIAAAALGFSFGILLLMPFALSGILGRLKAKIKMRRAASDPSR